MFFTALRLTLLVLCATVAVTQWPERDAYAASSTQISLRPALTAANVNEYGLHFDEGTSYYGGYDYQGPVGTNVYLRGRADVYQFYPARFAYRRINPADDCDIEAKLQRYVSGSWVDIASSGQHFLHLQNSAGSAWQYTPSIQSADSTYSRVVGQIAPQSDCLWEPHAHHSAILSGSISADGKTDDTCWSDNSQCNIGTVRKHKVGSVCPPGQQDGTHTSRSGNFAQYYCASWQIKTRSSSAAAFLIP